MSGAAEDVARMLTLVPWLLERPGASVAEAAEVFGVSVGTIRRDLEHLDFCGLPGLGGGDLFEVDLVGDRVVVGMADELRRPLRPTPREALRLVLTVDAVTEVLGEEIPALRSGVAKVREALGVPARLADVLPDEPASPLPDVRRAIEERLRLRIRYRGRVDTEPRSRVIDPWTLHVEDGVWYLHAFDREAEGTRTFRLDRISALEVLEEAATAPVPEQLPAPRYRPSGDDVPVVLELEPGARWVADAVDVDRTDELGAGRLRIALSTDAPAWIARLVLMAAGGARVVEPDRIRREVAELARRARDRAAELAG